LPQGDRRPLFKPFVIYSVFAGSLINHKIILGLLFLTCLYKICDDNHNLKAIKSHNSRESNYSRAFPQKATYKFKELNT